MKATEVFRFGDHVGGIVHNLQDNTLNGVNWVSRRLYKWTLDGSGKVTNVSTKPEELRVTNPALYIDYQDCKYLGKQEMLCSGLNNYQKCGRTCRAFRWADWRSSTSAPTA